MKKFLNVIKLLSSLLILYQHANAFDCSYDQNYTTLTCRYDYLTFDSEEGKRRILNYALFPGEKDARLYYQSTGSNSGYPETVFPFYGIDERNKSFDKNDPRQAQDILDNKFIMEISNEYDRRNFINSLNTYAMRTYEVNNVNYKYIIDNDKKFKDLITRLGSLKDARFSYQFNSPLWVNDYSPYDESATNVLIDALKEIFNKEDRVVGIFENNKREYNMEDFSAQNLNKILYDFTS